MRVPSRSADLAKQSRFLFNAMERLRCTLDHDHREWAALLRLSYKEYERIWSQRKPLPATALVHVAERLHLSIDQLTRGDIDYNAVAAHYSGDFKHIPEKYLVAATSRKSTALCIIDFTTKTSGWMTGLEALRWLQIHPAALHDETTNVNIRFMTELFGFLRKKRLTDEHIRLIGSDTGVRSQNSALGKRLACAKSPSEVYESMIVELIAFWERNCDYQLIKLTRSNCLIKSSTNQEVAEKLRVRHVGSSNVCLFRMGLLSSAPGYIGLPFANVEEKACVHRGDPACLFEVDFRKAAHVAAMH